MSDHQNPFREEWRDCLREHYKYVVRHDSRVTLESLRQVLLGGERPLFHEDELRALYIEATMRAEDMPDGFVPELLAETPQAPLTSPLPGIPQNPAHPLECQCPSCVALNVIPHDEEGQPLDDEALAELHEELAHKKDGPDLPKQLSLF